MTCCGEEKGKVSESSLGGQDELRWNTLVEQMSTALVKPTSHTPSTGQVMWRYTDLVTLTEGGRGRNAGIGQSSSIPTLLPLASEQQRGDFSVINVVCLP